MVNEEILTALQNAIERNEDLEEASFTLVNAGYSKQEVIEAINYLKSGVLSSQQAAEASPIEEKPKESIFSKIGGSFSSLGSKIKDVAKNSEEKVSSIFKKKEQPPVQEIAQAPEKPLPTIKSSLSQASQPLPQSSIPVPSMPSDNKNKILIAAIIVLMILILGLIFLILFKDKIT
jgi:hypothetical protein